MDKKLQQLQQIQKQHRESIINTIVESASDNVTRTDAECMINTYEDILVTIGLQFNPTDIYTGDKQS